MTAVTGAPLAVETSGLGKRYGGLWALQECSLRIPKGRVTALVGPNGAGKTTLLRMLAGLSAPTTGSAAVLGCPPGQSEEFLSSIGYLAQDIPLYKRLSADEHLEIGARLNRRWDASGARERLAALRIPLDRPVLSALGRPAGAGRARPRPGQAASGAAPRRAGGSIGPSGPEEVPHLAGRGRGRRGPLGGPVLSPSPRPGEGLRPRRAALGVPAEICDDIGHILATHKMLVGPRRKLSDLERGVNVVKATQTANQTRLIVRADGPVLDPSWQVDEVGLEDIVLAYMGQEELEDAGHPVPLWAAS